jgi:hypothetical protein
MFQLCREWQDDEDELLFPHYDPETGELTRDSWVTIAARLRGR